MLNVRSPVSRAVVYLEAIVTTNSLQGFHILRFSPFFHTAEVNAVEKKSQKQMRKSESF